MLTKEHANAEILRPIATTITQIRAPLPANQVYCPWYIATDLQRTPTLSVREPGDRLPGPLPRQNTLAGVMREYHKSAQRHQCPLWRDQVVPLPRAHRFPVLYILPERQDFLRLIPHKHILIQDSDRLRLAKRV